MSTAADVRAIAKTLSFYSDVVTGEVTMQCDTFSKILCTALRKSGIPAIIVTGDAHTGTREHHYLMVKLEEGVRIVDPTAGQYLNSLKGDIYIGTRDELLKMGREFYTNGQWQRIWSDRPFLSKHSGTRYDAIFREQWEALGVVAEPATLIAKY